MQTRYSMQRNTCVAVCVFAHMKYAEQHETLNLLHAAVGKKVCARSLGRQMRPGSFSAGCMGACMWRRNANLDIHSHTYTYIRVCLRLCMHIVAVNISQVIRAYMCWLTCMNFLDECTHHDSIKNMEILVIQVVCYDFALCHAQAHMVQYFRIINILNFSHTLLQLASSTHTQAQLLLLLNICQ